MRNKSVWKRNYKSALLSWLLWESALFGTAYSWQSTTSFPTPITIIHHTTESSASFRRRRRPATTSPYFPLPRPPTSTALMHRHSGRTLPVHSDHHHPLRTGPSITATRMTPSRHDASTTTTINGNSTVAPVRLAPSHKLSNTDENMVDHALLQEELNQVILENERLKAALHRIEIENERLVHDFSGRIVLETFEGEGKLRQLQQQPHHHSYTTDVTLASSLSTADIESAPDETQALWCDELEDGACPLEPTLSFGEALRDRAYWLVGLLVLQSASGLILANNESLLAKHPVSKYNRYTHTVSIKLE
jgi:hypothetical protein